MSSKSRDTEEVWITAGMAKARGHNKLLRLYHVLNDDEVDDHREDLDSCPYYEDCLAKAAYESWRSFSCKFCDKKELK